MLYTGMLCWKDIEQVQHLEMLGLHRVKHGQDEAVFHQLQP
jgi:ribosomal protein L30/L7E